MPTKRPKVEEITQAEYARRAGVNKSTINRQVRDGLIPTHGPRKLIRPAEADEARRNNTDPSRGKHKPKVDTTRSGSAAKTTKPPTKSKAAAVNKDKVVSYQDARAYGQELKNLQAEIELARLREELISREAVKRAMAELAQASVKAWVQWPSRVYAQMAAELGVDAATLHQVLDRHVRANAEEISQAPVEFRQPARKKSA